VPLPVNVVFTVIVFAVTLPAVVAPIFTLFMLPAVAGAIVTRPEPVGLITTLAFAGLNATAPLAVNVLANVPAVAEIGPPSLLVTI
jgi:hypothetical protein